MKLDADGNMVLGNIDSVAMSTAVCINVPSPRSKRKIVWDGDKYLLVTSKNGVVSTFTVLTPDPLPGTLLKTFTIPPAPCVPCGPVQPIGFIMGIVVAYLLGKK